MRIITKLSFISAFLLTSFGVGAQEPENSAPSVMGIPGESIVEGHKFAPIKLDRYVTDDMDKPETIKWSVSGNKQLKVSISPERIATIEIPNQYWNGSEDITFIAMDSKDATGSETVTFNVESVNDAPQFVKQIPNQTIDEKKQFAKINLNEFVKDADHKNSELSWEADVKHQGKEPQSGTLSVNIGDDHVASIEIPDPYWNGAAVVTFTVSDPEGASVKQAVTLTVKSINDVPVIKTIPNQTISATESVSTIALNDFINDDDHSFDNLKITMSGNTNLDAFYDKTTFNLTVAER